MAYLRSWPGLSLTKVISRSKLRGVFSRGPGNRGAQPTHKTDVLPFVSAADVVRLPYPSFGHDLPDSRRVISHIQPIPNVAAVTVHGERLSLQHIQDHEGDELLRELVRAVIVGAVGERYRETVGVVVGHDQVITSRLACGIRGPRVVTGLFGEEPGFPKRPENLIRADVMENRSRLGHPMRGAQRPAA